MAFCKASQVRPKAAADRWDVGHVIRSGLVLASSRTECRIATRGGMGNRDKGCEEENKELHDFGVKAVGNRLVNWEEGLFVGFEALNPDCC
jgi:hypothetical protein